jgi:hypothetical protein
VLLRRCGQGFSWRRGIWTAFSFFNRMQL